MPSSQLLRVVAVATVCVCAVDPRPLLGAEQTRGQETGLRLQPFGDIRWTSSTWCAGCKETVLAWSPVRGSHYESMMLWPTGISSPFLKHRAFERGVVLWGTLVIELEGGTSQELHEGWYYELPGEVKHRLACAPAEDCVFYRFGPTRGDVELVEAREEAEQERPEHGRTPFFINLLGLKWREAAVVSGGEQALVSGRPYYNRQILFNVLAARLNRWPPGAARTVHSHRNPVTGLILKGEVLISMGAQAPARLDRGSYFFIPKGLGHSVACGESAVCVFIASDEESVPTR